MRNEWVTATVTTPRHLDIFQDIANALWNPQQVAIIKVAAHRRAGSLMAQGNAEADKQAKKAAGLRTTKIYVMKTVEERINK